MSLEPGGESGPRVTTMEDGEIELKEIAEALSHLGDKGSEAFITWVWMTTITRVSGSVVILSVVSIAARTICTVPGLWRKTVSVIGWPE